MLLLSVTPTDDVAAVGWKWKSKAWGWVGGGGNICSEEYIVLLRLLLNLSKMFSNVSSSTMKCPGAGVSNFLG